MIFGIEMPGPPRTIHTPKPHKQYVLTHEQSFLHHFKHFYKNSKFSKNFKKFEFLGRGARPPPLRSQIFCSDFPYEFPKNSQQKKIDFFFVELKKSKTEDVPKITRRIRFPHLKIDLRTTGGLTFYRDNGQRTDGQRTDGRTQIHFTLV